MRALLVRSFAFFFFAFFFFWISGRVSTFSIFPPVQTGSNKGQKLFFWDQSITETIRPVIIFNGTLNHKHLNVLCVGKILNLWVIKSATQNSFRCLIYPKRVSLTFGLYIIHLWNHINFGELCENVKTSSVFIAPEVKHTVLKFIPHLNMRNNFGCRLLWTKSWKFAEKFCIELKILKFVHFQLEENANLWNKK